MLALDKLAKAIIDCDEERAPMLTQVAIDEGIPADRVLNEGLLAGMTKVGRLFRDGEYFVPEVLIAAEAMKACTTLLKPHLQAAGIKPIATALIGTVQGDLHDIGKNLVATMLEGAGFSIIDLGVDVPPDKFVAALREHEVQLVALSALLTTTMPMLDATVKAIKAEFSVPPVILIGGAPVTPAYAEQIGADGYGRDAATAADLAKSLCLATPS